MAWLTRLLIVFAFLSVLLLGALAMIDNQTRVSLRFLEWQTMPLSIYWWLLATLALGFSLGWSFGGFARLRQRVGGRQLRRQLEQSQREVERLREPPLRD